MGWLAIRGGSVANPPSVSTAIFKILDSLSDASAPGGMVGSQQFQAERRDVSVRPSNDLYNIYSGRQLCASH